MSKLQMLREFVSQRLTSAVEEIFVLFERTITEYEDEVSRSKEENERQRKLLDAVWSPEVHFHRADVQRLLVQQEWSSSVKREDPGTLHMKEEPWSHQEGEHLQGLEETAITKFPYTHVLVKNENDDEEVQFSQHRQSQTEENRPAEIPAGSSTDQMKTEADGDSCGGQEPARNLDPASKHKDSDSSEPETKNDERNEAREHQLGLKPSKQVSLKDMRCDNHKKSFICSKCNKIFDSQYELKRHMRIHMVEKPFICSVCGKRLIHKKSLPVHMRIHSGEKPFSCSICRKNFTHKSSLTIHIRIHSAEKPFSCSVCSKTFTHNANLTAHLRVHSGEKSFSCSVCGKRFTRKGNLTVHLKIHSGEVHMRHTSGSSVCGSPHKVQRVHDTGVKQFSCSL